VDFNFEIDAQLDVPIYQQLVDRIRVQVKKGILKDGQQLPTVQEMAQGLAVARGTIKRAYDELEREGMIEKVQGRGTFVSYRPVNTGSRKEQAMVAIDNMLDALEEMGFSAQEVNIFLNLKLRERAEQEDYVKVAVLECNPENLSQMSEQLHHIKKVDLYSFLLDNVQQYPYKLDDSFDLIVTTATHAEYLSSVLSADKRIARVALRPSAHSLSGIIKLRQGQVVGVLGYSSRFGQLLYDTCQTYTEGVVLTEPQVFSTELDIDGFLEGKDAVLVPVDYEKYCSAMMTEKLRRFGGELITCYYKMDEGSVLYLEEKVRRILEKKSL